jgi:beta-glucanase (GH16 family)
MVAVPSARRFGRNTALVVAAAALVVGGCATGHRAAATVPTGGSPPCPPGAAQTAAAAADPHSAAAINGWALTEHDEFGGTCLDTGHWGVYDSPGSGGVGLRRPAAISVGDGELRITARGEVSGGMAWVGAPTTYGRWEVRMRADRGSGYSAVVLLWPDSDRWPIDGEVDFAEISAPNRDRNDFTLHWGRDNSQESVTLNGDFTQWHDYAVEWEPDHLTIFVDGLAVYRTTDPVKIPRVPMHLAVQQDVLDGEAGSSAAGLGSPTGVIMHVDWVRMYRR